MEWGSIVKSGWEKRKAKEQRRTYYSQSEIEFIIVLYRSPKDLLLMGPLLRGHFEMNLFLAVGFG
jgi:hypothetical protein